MPTGDGGHDHRNRPQSPTRLDHAGKLEQPAFPPADQRQRRKLDLLADDLCVVVIEAYSKLTGKRASVTWNPYARRGIAWYSCNAALTSGTASACNGRIDIWAGASPLPSAR